MDVEEDYNKIEEEKEESIDYEYEMKAIEEFEEEEEDEVEDLEELPSPWVSSWIDDADGKIVDGIMVMDPKNKSQLPDCSICYQPWTCRGKHQICSLPCGHIYGLSCIKRWLLQSSSVGKCPQCNTLCAHDHVLRLSTYGKILHDDDDESQLSNCSICYQPWTCLGDHRICSLPCGHMYGLSCIKKWLLQNSSRGKCPQCNTLCAYDDVVLLYASHLCVADHQKVSSTRRFPFTRQGAIDYQHYEALRKVNAVELWLDEKEHLSNVLKHLNDAKDLLVKLEVQWHDMLARAEKLEEQAKELNDSADARRADALRLRADALERRAVEFERRANALDRRADVLERRLDVLERRVDASESNLYSFVPMYIGHHKKNTEPCAFSVTTLVQQLYDDLFPSSGAH